MKKQTIVLVAGLAGCGHQAAAPRVDREVPPTSGSAAVAPRGGAPATPGAVPALAGDGPHAFVVDAGGLVEVAPSGKTQAIGAVKPQWCSADARAQVVWFADDRGLSAFDLVDRRIHPIVAGEIGADTYTIDYGDQHLGAESAVDYQLALAVVMTKPARAASQLGCDGDQGVYCYEEGDIDKLVPSLVEKQKKLDAAVLADPVYVASLVDRSAGRSLWSPPPAPPVKPKKRPRVDRKACTEDPKACGRLTAIPASPLWLVTTSSSRGDFYHEDRALWDPATGEYVAIANGKLVRSKNPRADNADYADMRIAPSGMLSIGGVVFDPGSVVYAPSGETPMTCGWSSGGWRMPGVRGDSGD